MKSLKFLMMFFTLVTVIGCGKEKKAATSPQVVPPPPGTPYIPPGTGPGLAPGGVYGGSAPLTVTSSGVMGKYTGRPMNNPQNIRINLNMVKTGNTFGGTATVTYTDNGYPYEGYFTAGSSSDVTKYNIVFTTGGQNVWHAVFEDFMGGLVVVIDQIVDLGDGQGPQDSVGGSVWFKNFGLTYAPHPPTYCWFVSIGPYDCRPWPKDKGMDSASTKDPGAGYEKLGTFSGLSVKAAFNGQALW